MDSKIQELAQKIYHDGVEKASEEAAKIIAEAEAKRDELLAGAKKEAEAIVHSAKEERAQIQDQSAKELKAAVENATVSLQSKVADMVTAGAVSQGVDEALASPEALQAVIVRLSEQMFEQESNGVVVSTSDAEQLEAYFRKHAKSFLDKGVEIREVAGREAHFELAPKDGSYKIVVSSDAFKEFFAEFLRPQLKSMLFPSKEA